eukprot:354468-Chlamydomonas_euryale.AAC.2
MIVGLMVLSFTTHTCDLTISGFDGSSLLTSSCRHIREATQVWAPARENGVHAHTPGIDQISRDQTRGTPARRKGCLPEQPRCMLLR